MKHKFNITVFNEKQNNKQTIELAKEDLKTIKKNGKGKNLNMAFLDSRLTKLEDILGV